MVKPRYDNKKVWIPAVAGMT
nr:MULTISPECIES: hypothetical protein [Rickettsia]